VFKNLISIIEISRSLDIRSEKPHKSNNSIIVRKAHGKLVVRVRTFKTVIVNLEEAEFT